MDSDAPNPDGLLYVVDDDEAVRLSLSRLLTAAGFKPVMFDSARSFLETADTACPGCLVLDLSMPGMDGLALQESLNARGSPLAIIFLTGRGTLKECVTGIQRGASNFLSKPYDAQELIGAISRGLLESRERLAQRDDLKMLRERLATLTPREDKVMHLVARGLLNKQIADLIGIAERTVKLHRSRVMEKLQVGSVAELVRLVDRGRQ